MVWFWSFLVYSWLGFLLEAVYALWVGASPDRKCLAVLPLCPVYGLGACAILLLVPRETALLPLFLLGCGTATAAEYAASLFYQRVLGVSFWDYRGLPGSVQGRVCLPFSLAWGLLSIPLVRWLPPALVPWLAGRRSRPRRLVCGGRGRLRRVVFRPSAAPVRGSRLSEAAHRTGGGIK